MRVVAVFDTNILISAVLSLTGKPFRCVAQARFGVIESVTCEEVLAEFAEKLRDKLGFPADKAQAASDEVRAFSRIVSLGGTLKAVPTDPDDDKVVECAVVGRAGYIVTGDHKHLLPIGTYQGIRIVTAAEFLAIAASSP